MDLGRATCLCAGVGGVGRAVVDDNDLEDPRRTPASRSSISCKHGLDVGLLVMRRERRPRVLAVAASWNGPPLRRRVALVLQMAATIPNSEAVLCPREPIHQRGRSGADPLGALAVYWAVQRRDLHVLQLPPASGGLLSWRAGPGSPNPPSWLTEFAWYGGRPYVYFRPVSRRVFLIPFAQVRRAG